MDPGVVHDRVDAAESGNDFIAHALRIALDIAGYDARALAELAREHLGRNALRRVMQRDACAGSVDAAGNAGADSAPRSGDEHHAPAEIEQCGDFWCDHDGTVPFDRSSVLWTLKCRR